jgi:hypothetical protein
MDRTYAKLDTTLQTLVEAPGQYILGTKLKSHFVSPFIVSDPIDSTVPLAERFRAQQVRQAVIISSQRVPIDDRFYEASRTFWQTYGDLIYAETGRFTAIGRTYGPDGMSGEDSIKVYQLR